MKNMKRLFWIIAALISIIIVCFVSGKVIFPSTDREEPQAETGTYPFADIDESDIEWIAAEHGPFLLYKLSQDEQEKLIPALRKIIRYEEDINGTHLNMMGARRNIHFLLRYANGKVVTIAEASSYLVMDGVWYYADSETMSEMSEIYDELVGFC